MVHNEFTWSIIHIHQGCFVGTGAIVKLPQNQLSKPNGYGKISQCKTATKHSIAKTVWLFLGIYCSIRNRKKTFRTKSSVSLLYCVRSRFVSDEIFTDWTFLLMKFSPQIFFQLVKMEHMVLGNSNIYIYRGARWDCFRNEKLEEKHKISAEKLFDQHGKRPRKRRECFTCQLTRLLRHCSAPDGRMHWDNSHQIAWHDQMHNSIPYPFGSVQG